MPLTNDTAAIRARQLITEQSEGATDIAIPRLKALIPTALEAWTRLCFESREKRELFKVRFTAEVEGGLLDLTSLLDGTDGRINLKELRETTIYAGETLENDSESESESEAEIEPCTWVNSMFQLSRSRPAGTSAPAVFLDGRTLRFRSADGFMNQSTTIEFTVTNFPAAVGNVPFTLEHDFIRFLAMMAEGGKDGDR